MVAGTIGYAPAEEIPAFADGLASNLYRYVVDRPVSTTGKCRKKQPKSKKHPSILAVQELFRPRCVEYVAVRKDRRGKERATK
jgi:hypothetical protein